MGGDRGAASSTHHGWCSYCARQTPDMVWLALHQQAKRKQDHPYNKITKCDVWEPSDTSVVCCCIRNTLSQLRIEVAPSIESRGKAEKVVLAGIKHPFAFRQAVYTMKHSEAPSINAKGFVQ